MLQILFRACLMAGSFALLSATEPRLDTNIFTYEDFANHDPATLQGIKKALLDKGIVGIRGVPGYRESAEKFIASAREFASLTEEQKQKYTPNRLLNEITGYEIGAEKFQRPDGEWIVDDAKASYYAFIPNDETNRWPDASNLKTAYLEIGQIMFDTGIQLLKSIELVDSRTNVPIDSVRGIGRMLHYRKQSDATMDNPFWCGAHFDHGLFTALMPAYYFRDGIQVAEPEEAGLFVRLKDDQFKKVVSDDPDVLLFQVGEFGQLAMDDEIIATEHRVHKARGGIERFTLAVFFFPPFDTEIRSKSNLINDSRYGMNESCTYKRWHEESLRRYLVEEEKD